jgi:subtilisin family serine protease
MNTKLLRSGLGVLALGVGLVAAAQPADAARWKARHVARGQPVNIPVLLDANRTLVETQFAIAQVRAPGAQQYSQGTGITVAVLDGGFDLTHEFFDGRTVPGWDCLNWDGNPQDLGDWLDNDFDGATDACVGHGTFVSGLILSTAPDVRIMPLRVLDDETYGTDWAVAAGIMYAVNHGANVINMSLVMPDVGWVVRFALRQAAAAGVIVVGAAGNSGESDLWRNDPEIAGKVLAVGAVDSLDVMCSWSCTGDLVDLYAPGNAVIGPLGGHIPNSYAIWSGTSFAAPFAAGAAAMMLSANPALLPQDIVTKVMNTADPAFGVTPVNRGRLDCLGAITQ